MTDRVSMRDFVKAMNTPTLEAEIIRSEEVVARLSGTIDPDGKMQLLVAQCHLMAVRSERTLRQCRVLVGKPEWTAPAPKVSNVVCFSTWKQTHSK
jgi:hypothetical protein